LNAEFQEEGWDVVRANDKDDALYRMRLLEEEGKSLDVAAIDLGLPPAKDDPQNGIDLIATIRDKKEYRDLPILAYTSLNKIDYPAVVRRLAVYRASFISLRPLGDELRVIDILKFVRRGFFLLSPAPASFLHASVPFRPDPLDEKLWETLAYLNQGLTQNQVATELAIAADTVKTRIERTREILAKSGEVPINARTEDLLAWYREHRVRYAWDK